MAAVGATVRELESLDAAAQVLAQEVGRVLVSEARRDDGQLGVRRRGLADAAQGRAQLGQRVRDERDDPDRHSPTSCASMTNTMTSPVTSQPTSRARVGLTVQ